MILFAGLIKLITMIVPLYMPLEIMSKQKNFIVGEYSVDGGAWQKIDLNAPIDDLFHTIVFRGTMSSHFFYYEELCISSPNVWYTLHNADNTAGIAFFPLSEEEWAELDETYDSAVKYHPYARQSPQTPGYIFYKITKEEMSLDTEITPEMVFTLEVTTPYPQAMRFSDCFSIQMSHGNGFQLQYLIKSLPLLVLYLLICFLGLFLFPIAGFFGGKVNFQYFTFGTACFFWGLSNLVTRSANILNFFIPDYVLCMMLDILLNDMFILSLLCYLNSLLKGKTSCHIGNLLIISNVVYIFMKIILQISVKTDLFATSFYHSYYEMTCTIIFLILLFSEYRKNKETLLHQLSWFPIIIAIIMDIVGYLVMHYHNEYLLFTGFSISMLFQMAQLVLDLRRQFIESINYQKVQKELYEAKVGIMVSQIQPHFMYNALSSIAILCKLEPDTAYTATVTFSDYLRENMDSLKQTAPVPFTKELEHLKKYLYIEKLRFADKLNIIYDIQATDFEIPLLSIQPIVENAVKHGVGMKKKGGTVRISTRDTDSSYQICVCDDGVGFDVNEKKQDGRSHVGMENTRKRLKDMCHAEISVESTIGEGTTVTITIPKEPKGESNL